MISRLFAIPNCGVLCSFYLENPTFISSHHRAAQTGQTSQAHTPSGCGSFRRAMVDIHCRFQVWLGGVGRSLRYYQRSAILLCSYMTAHNPPAAIGTTIAVAPSATVPTEASACIQSGTVLSARTYQSQSTVMEERLWKIDDLLTPF